MALIKLTERTKTPIHDHDVFRIRNRHRRNDFERAIDRAIRRHRRDARNTKKPK